MREPWRSHYLHAMGVTVHVPRVALPGALPSTACEWDLPAVTELAAQMRTPATVDERVAPAPIPARPIAPTAAPREPARRVAPQPAPPATNTSTTPRFALGISVSDTGVLIVDDAPSSPAARGEYLRLLGNLLFALQRKTATLSLDVFAWPMLKNSQIDQSAAAAREAVSAYLQKQIHNHAVHTVLLLGDNARAWVAASGEQPHRAASISAWSCLREPQRKRELWQDLRHLAGRS